MPQVALVSEAKWFGGAEVYLERLALSLPGWEASVGLPARSSLDGWRERLERLGIPYHAASPGVAGWPGLAAWMRRERFDLIHVNLPATYDGAHGLLPAWLRMATGIPVVTSEHLTHLPRSRRRRLVKLATTGAVSRIVVNSEGCGEALVAEGVPAGKIEAVPNGVPDPGPPQPLPPGEPLRIGVMATLEPRKQIDLLLRGVAASGTTAEVDIAGDGESLESLRRLTGELDLGERVRFRGRVEDPGFHADHHVLGLSSRLEGMPLVLLEAAAAARGALVSDLPGTRAVVVEGKTGRLLSSTDPQPWADAVRELAGDPTLAARWGAAARMRYEDEFTLDRSARRTEAVYRAVLRERA